VALIIHMTAQQIEECVSEGGVVEILSDSNVSEPEDTAVFESISGLQIIKADDVCDEVQEDLDTQQPPGAGIFRQIANGFGYVAIALVAIALSPLILLFLVLWVLGGGASHPATSSRNKTDRSLANDLLVVGASAGGFTTRTGTGFSLNRTLGISGAKARISRAIGVPLTRSGRQRKLGSWWRL
jgi:hypothetical protein